MAGEACDVCGVEPGQYALTDRDTGMTQFIGPNCLALLGFTMQLQADQPVVDALLKQAGYAVTKAERARRQAELAPEFDAGRTIAEVVETAPRSDDDEPADDEPGEVQVGETMDGRPITQPIDDGGGVATGQQGDLSTPESTDAKDPEAAPY